MLPIGTAEHFIERGVRQRQRRRDIARRRGVLPHVLRLLIAEAGPVTREALARALPGFTAARLDRELTRLDAQDHIFLQDGAVTLAYPFSGLPNAFRVRLANGAERYACCAIDALGIAPMAGARVEIRARCHHCGTPLEFSAAPAGPGPEADGVMRWVGTPAEDRSRVADSL